MSEYLELSGAPLHRAVIQLPLQGAWVADVEHIEAPTVAVGDEVTLTLGSQSWVGTVYRVDPGEGRRWDTRIVGGGGGLSTVLAPRQYRSPPASLVVQDALVEAGEAVEAATLARLATSVQPAWVRRAETAAQLLDEVAAILSYRWRVLPSGAVWLGVDAGTLATFDSDLIETGAASGVSVVAALEPTVSPGQTWRNPQTGAIITVGAVIHRVDEQSTRTEIYALSGSGRLGEALSGVAARAAPPDLFACYEYTVVVQNGDGTLELRSGAPGLPDLSKVVSTPGAPGETFTVPAGARCMVAFPGGRANAVPQVQAWVSSTPISHSIPVTSLLHLGATAAADFVTLDALVQGQLTAIAASISNIAAAVNAIVPGSVTIIYGSTAPIGPTAATRVKAT